MHTRLARCATRLAAATLASTALAAGAGVTVLHGFDYEDGQYPEGRLLQGLDGRLYGTTYAGGTHGLGTVFAVSLQGVHTILHSFDGSDGDSLYAGLWQRADGALFGTAPQGTITVGGVTTSFGGAVFQLGPQGGLATLHRFPAHGQPDGSLPGALADGGDGFLYGTNRYGGSGDRGTVFRVAGDGTVSTVHAFSAAEGASPANALTRGPDGQFYGALGTGPNGNQNGALFRITRDGVVTILHTFVKADGRAPAPGLADIGDGYLYGVTGGGGPADAGTVFRIDAAGTLVTLYSFNGTDGSGPVGGLAAGPDGLLYGLTFGGGSGGGGTVFRVTPAGAFTTLHLLAPQNGTHPVAAPVFGSDARLYGVTTQYGGAPGASGSVFAFDALQPQPPVLGMDKYCYNEFNICFRPINTTVGHRYTVAWYSANLDHCLASGAWSGPRAPAGRLDVTPLQAGVFTYRLACTGPSGVRNGSVTVTVGGRP